MVRRGWKLARAKVDREGKCRVCGSTRILQAAHVMGRRFDDEVEVNPDETVPLCIDCHARYDSARDLDLLPYLTRSEQAAAVLLAGIESARRRITGTRPN